MKLIKTAAIAFSALFITTVAFAQTAEEIVKKNIEAIGGADAWKKVNTVRQEGTMTVQGAEVSVALIAVNGKGVRQDISVMGMTGYQIVTPSAGWSFMPFQGQQKPEALTEEQLKESIDDLDIQGKLIDYSKKGHTVELLGKDDVEGTECFKLKITSKTGNVETIFVDPKSYLVVRSISKRKANGQEQDVTTDYSNYQKLPEGIVIPMSVTLGFGELKITKVEVNKAIDEAIFKPAQ